MTIEKINILDKIKHHLTIPKYAATTALFFVLTTTWCNQNNWEYNNLNKNTTELTIKTWVNAQQEADAFLDTAKIQKERLDPNAIVSYTNALEKYKELNDHKNMYRCELNIGKIEFNQNNFVDADEHFIKWLKYASDANYHSWEFISLRYILWNKNRSADVDDNVDTNIESIQWYIDYWETLWENLNKEWTADSKTLNMYLKFLQWVTTYQTQSWNLEEANNTINKILSYNEDNLNKNTLLATYVILWDLKNYEWNYMSAINAFNHAEELWNSDEPRSDITYGKMEAYAKLKNFEQAFLYSTQYSKLRSQHIQDENIRAVKEVKGKYESEIKDEKIKTGEQELKTSEEKRKSEEKTKRFLLWILGLWSVWWAFFYKEHKKTQKAKKEAEKSKNIAEWKEKEIRSWLSAWKIVQEKIVLNPSHNKMKNAFDDMFVLLKPHTEVSWDFHWSGITKSWKPAVALVDCTWHGVQWALISMAGNWLLNEAINKWLEEPWEIIDHLKQGMLLLQKEWFRKSEDNDKYKDDNSIYAMDIAIFTTSKNNRELKFSWAKLSMYISSWLRSGIKEIKWDKQSIWYDIKDEKSWESIVHKYKTHTIPLKWPHNTIFFSTDWFMDQFWWPNWKKFMKKSFKATLWKANDTQLESLKKDEKDQIPFENIWEKLNDIIKKWMKWWKDIFQVDDISVLWIRIDAEKHDNNK